MARTAWLAAVAGAMVPRSAARHTVPTRPEHRDGLVGFRVSLVLADK